MAYTQNLPVTYNVYELTKVSTEAEGDITVEGKNSAKSYFKKQSPLHKRNEPDNISGENNKEMYGEKVSSTVNLGKYDIYDKTENTEEFLNLTTTVNDEGNITFDWDYYMIEIKWNDEIKFSDYLKETDLVYVIVNAMQLEPKEATQQ